MLVLSRKAGETIRIGEHITVTINRIDGGRVSLAFDAPREVAIARGELNSLAAEALAGSAGNPDPYAVVGSDPQSRSDARFAREFGPRVGHTGRRSVR